MRTCQNGFGQKQLGQALVEYVVLLLIATLIAISTARFFNQLVLEEGLPRFNAVLEKELRNAKLPRNQHLGIWTN